MGREETKRDEFNASEVLGGVFFCVPFIFQTISLATRLRFISFFKIPLA